MGQLLAKTLRGTLEIAARLSVDVKISLRSFHEIFKDSSALTEVKKNPL